MKRICIPAVLLALLSLAACGPAPTDPGPGGVTTEDAQALDKAAEKLDREFADPSASPDASGQR